MAHVYGDASQTMSYMSNVVVVMLVVCCNLVLSAMPKDTACQAMVPYLDAWQQMGV